MLSHGLSSRSGLQYATVSSSSAWRRSSPDTVILGRFLHRIQRDETFGFHHCVDRPENTVEHTVEVCPAWPEHRRVLREAIGGRDLSRPALVEAMVQGGAEAWEAVEEAASNFRLPTPPPPESKFEWAPERTPARTLEAAPGVSVTISGHRRRGLADGDQRVALRPIKTRPESTACCVPRSKSSQYIRRSPIAGQTSVGVSGTVQTWYRGPRNLGNWKERVGFLVSWSLTLPVTAPWVAGVIWWYSLCPKNRPSSEKCRSACASHRFLFIVDELS